MKQSIAIVGAGVGGAVCARHLADRGHAVTVFDKGRGPGGRTSSRRTPTGHRFDHGVPWFDVARPEMHAALAPAVAAGVLLRTGDTYASPTGPSALCKWLLDGLPAEYGTKVVRVGRDAGWAVWSEAGVAHGPFDAVVLAVPPVNAAEAVGGHDAALTSDISAVRMLPRWVAMFAFAERQDGVPDRATVAGHVVRRSMSNAVGDALVIEASEAWSVEHVEQDAVKVGTDLLEHVRPALGGATPASITAHRWRYAFAESPLGRPFLTGQHGLFVCGDWCLGRSVEAAWQSGAAVAAALA